MSLSDQNRALAERMLPRIVDAHFITVGDRTLNALLDAARAEGAPGAAEAFSALDVADRIIERACGLDVADEWNAIYSSVALARSNKPLQAEGAPAAEELAPRPMDAAPRDGTLVRLLVDYSGDDADHPLEDDTVAWTVGANNFDNDCVDAWKFAGWCWSHDHYTEGRGEVVGWLPFHGELA